MTGGEIPVKTTAAAVALFLILATIVTAFAITESPAPGASEADQDIVITIHDDTVTSFDGTEIKITVFRPELDEDLPVVLHSHGWSGSRTTSLGGIVEDLVLSGYGVISIDARGHGESGGQAHVHNRHVEVKDFQAVLDYASELDWVLEDDLEVHEKNIVAGAVGGSYGGGYQLMTASFDPRLNALVPEMTWNDLTYSLAPNGAIKTVWVSALYGLAHASGTRIIDEINDWFLEAYLTNGFPDEAFDHFKDSSPEPQDIRAHVLLQQSFMDTLFNVNEGLANHQALLENAGEDDYEIVFWSYLGGHVSPTGGLPWQAPDSIMSSPCGDMNEITVAWFDRHLKGLNVEPPAPVSYALESGGCITRDTTDPDDVISVDLPQVAAPQGTGSLVLPLLTIEEETHIAGIPQISFSATGLHDTILHASLAVAAGPSGPHVINHQVTGMRFDATLDGAPQDFDMNAVATKLLPGDVLVLRLDAASEQYIAHGNRTPGAVLLDDITVHLPIVDVDE
jgi:ABC-2 type transport system ATP-binding protein